MLKKLRNKMLVLNMACTFCLIIISFIVIYSITYTGVEKEIKQSLFRAFSTHHPMPPRDNSIVEREFQFPKIDEKDQNNSGQTKRKLNDTRNFSVYVTADGVIETNSMFGENSELYNAVAQQALQQNNDKGEFKSENVYWRFLTVKKDDGSRLIALADISAERGIIIHLMTSFTACAAILLVLVFIASLFFAERSIKPVREAWEKQKQFVADASHELKTPLAAINTNVDVLLASPEKTIGTQEKWLTYIKSEAERLTGLTGNLLFMARLDGAAQIQLTRTMISDIFESVALNMEAVAYEKKKNYSFDIQDNIFANANGEQLTRLCLILIDNAIKYSPDGGAVSVRFYTSQKDAVLSVTNDGEPIPEKEHDKIFDRFYRVDKSRTGNSYGLGLAIAKEIAQIHHGRLTVSSTLKEGTCFSFSIPCIK